MLIIFAHSKLLFDTWTSKAFWVLRRESLVSLKEWFLQMTLFFDYIVTSVLLEKTPLVKFIRNYMRDSSDVFFP